jgi:NAD(P)H dehydrogenase (quinone)
MNAIDLIAITGATGDVGGKVARRLSERGLPLRLVVRDPTRAPDLPGSRVAVADYADRDSMLTALDGVGTLFLVSAREAVDRLDHHRQAVEAAAASGVGKIVYLSFLGASPDATFVLARQHFHTEEMIKETGASYVFLRDAMYLDYVPFLVGRDGVLRGPGGQGRAGFVSRDDVAEAAAAAVASSGYDGTTFDITGPESISLEEAAARLAGFLGRPITYQAETEEEAYASRAVYGAPDWEVEGWVTSYLAIAKGEMDVVSDSVARLTGHEPANLEACLSAHPEGYQHLLE